MSKLYEYIKERGSMVGCDIINDKWNCKDYMDCDICLQDKILEHDKQVRDKAIDDFAELCLKHKSKEEYPIMCFDEFTIKRFAEQLKGRE